MFQYSWKNSAKSLFLSGWLQISNTGFNSVETGTGPVAPLPGSLMCGSGIRIFLFFSITGIHAGAGDCLAMIVCCILLLFKLRISGLWQPVELQGPLLQMLPERQGFREKYRSRARMIFPGKPRKGPDLVVRTEAFATFAL